MVVDLSCVILCIARSSMGCGAEDSRHSSKIIRAAEKTHESSKLLFLGKLIPEIESKAPN